MNDACIRKFYHELNQVLEGDYKIILEPNRTLVDEWVEYDTVKWEMEEPLQKLVSTLAKDNRLSFEEKVLNIYEFICLNYIYDDNVLYFFKKDSSDLNNIKYIAVDWYGRIIDDTWKENRKKHNRRVCYEFARFYAKAINALLADSDDFEAFMVGDKENLHYFVGLMGNEYSAILDLDDFNSIKDLTRLKLGLTLQGIKILRDESGKLKKAIDEFNKNRLDELVEVQKVKEKLEKKNMIQYFSVIIDILKQYSIDSQGFFEYMRSKIEGEEIEIEKVWREVKGGNEKRYVRSLLFNFDEKTYLLDSVEKTLSVIDKEQLDKNIFIFNPEENEYSYYGG